MNEIKSKKELRSKKERCDIILDIVYKLKNYKTENGTINLYNEEYSYHDELKKIFNEYIKQDDENMKDFSGTLKFNEIGKNVEYYLPTTYEKNPLFVIRMNSKF